MIEFFKTGHRVFFIGLLIVIIAMFATNMSFAHGNGNGNGNGNGHGYDDGPGEGPGNGNGFGHNDDRSGHDTPDTPDTPNNKSSEGDPIPAYGCDTSWERATFEDCRGLPYFLFLQNNSTGNKAIQVERVGFSVPNPMTD